MKTIIRSYFLKNLLNLFVVFVIAVFCFATLSYTQAYAQETDLASDSSGDAIVDLCLQVPGNQNSLPCEDEICTQSSGVWTGETCQMQEEVPDEVQDQTPEAEPETEPAPESTSTPPTLPECSENEHLENEVCVPNEVLETNELSGPQTEIATSTDGTGGLIGGTIFTGDAVATTSVENELNTNSINPDTEGESNSSPLTNENNNEGDVASLSETVSATGENQAEGGVSLATVSTGHAVSTASVINVVNTNIFNSEGLVLFLNQLFGGGLDLREYDLSYFFGQPVDCETNPMILSCRNSSDLNVINTNLATVTNSVIVRSSTGLNTASSTEGGVANIETGDAYSAANVLNLVNTNLINSNYLLVSFNNFGNLDGDITLPNSNFFSQLLSRGGVLPDMNSSSVTAHNDNSAFFTGTTTTNAETGNNIASTTGTGAGEVTTGNAYSSSDTYNQLNETQVGGTSVFLLFRVWGDWTGDIQGLPPGMSWLETPSGIVLMSDGPQCSNNLDDDNDGFTDSFDATCHTNGSAGNEFTYDPYGTSESSPQCSNGIDDDSDGFIDKDDESCNIEDHGEIVYEPYLREISPNGEYNSSNVLASSTNTANVHNDVQVYALTGENQAITENATSTITTGDAYAAANVVNLINTNIIGRNWIFAIFNVFGDWDGNISFGRPDLWIGAVAETTNPTLPGSEVVYQFTVTNRGDVDAENVVLEAEFDENMLTFSGDGLNTNNASSSIQWNLGRIARGETKEFRYTAQVSQLPSGTSATVPLRASVRGALNDNNEVDNSEAVTIVVSSPDQSPAQGSSGGGGGGGGGGGSPGLIGSTSGSSALIADPKISITKSANMATSTVATTTIKVDYKVVVYNDKSAGPAYRGLLTDTMYDPSGEVMYNKSWNLDTIAPGDQITLTYTIEYGTSTIAGLYNNIARVTGKSGSNTLSYAKEMTPVEASLIFELNKSDPSGSILGTIYPYMDNGSYCLPLLTSYLRKGVRNNSIEVKKLQSFLNEYMQSNLPSTGFYGALTKSAVEAFQNRHKDKVLLPLGINSPTGSVYKLTLNEINAISCEGMTPLTYELNRGGGFGAESPTTQISSASPALEKKAKVPAKKDKVENSNVTNDTERNSMTANVISAPRGKIRSWFKNLFIRN
jgi:hypothetical protein